MNKGDPAAPGTTTGHLIDQLIPGLTTTLQRGVKIVDPVADMVNAGPPFLEKAGHGTLGALRGQELDFRFAERQRNDGGAIGGFRRMGNQAKNVTVESKGGVQIGDRHANVGNTGCLGHGVSGHEITTDTAIAASG